MARATVEGDAATQVDTAYVVQDSGQCVDSRSVEAPKAVIETAILQVLSESEAPACINKPQQTPQKVCQSVKRPGSQSGTAQPKKVTRNVELG